MPSSPLSNTILVDDEHNLFRLDLERELKQFDPSLSTLPQSNVFAYAEAAAMEIEGGTAPPGHAIALVYYSYDTPTAEELNSVGKYVRAGGTFVFISDCDNFAVAFPEIRWRTVDNGGVRTTTVPTALAKRLCPLLGTEVSLHACHIENVPEEEKLLKCTSMSVRASQVNIANPPKPTAHWCAAAAHRSGRGLFVYCGDVNIEGGTLAITAAAIAVKAGRGGDRSALDSLPTATMPTGLARAKYVPRQHYSVCQLNSITRGILLPSTAKQLQGKKVRVMNDNKAAIAVLTNHGTTRNRVMNAAVKEADVVLRKFRIEADFGWEAYSARSA